MASRRRVSLLLAGLLLFGCDSPGRGGGEGSVSIQAGSSPSASASTSEIAPKQAMPGAASASGAPSPGSEAPGAAADGAAADGAAADGAALLCPEGMQPISGGEFWVGTTKGTGGDEEWPRFKAAIGSFCLDRTEVTLKAYQDCVAKGACKPAGTEHRSCNQGKEGRGDHPVNCVDWHQAEAFCKARGARLPTEIEWEYAARGGAEYRSFSWGNEEPDGRTCWKQGGTCPVGKFPAGAFGLVDMTGNVWEWTADGFGKYPWPALGASSKVYRGGSWSRRFKKWMRPQLRNRFPADNRGSHLGMRCALSLPQTECQAGKDEAGQCLRQVLDVECEAGLRWNGARCAREGAPRCQAGWEDKPGFGCLSSHGNGAWQAEDTSAAITRSRSAEFDADCAKHYPGRPNAYRYMNGTHAARNAISQGAGCKNRDVGVGWNSTCCP